MAEKRLPDAAARLRATERNAGVRVSIDGSEQVSR